MATKPVSFELGARPPRAGSTVALEIRVTLLAQAHFQANLILGVSLNLLRQVSHLRSQTSDMARSRDAFTTARSST